jgi:hypothetical protein
MPMSATEAQASLAAALVILGALIKHAIPSEAVNRWIPLILVIAGTPLFCALVGAWGPAQLIQGLIAAASATGFHQVTTRTTGLNI